MTNQYKKTGTKYDEQIGEKKAKSIPLIHIYRIAHFTGFFIIL